MYKKLSLLLVMFILVSSIFAGCGAVSTGAASGILRFGTGSLDGVFNPTLSDSVYDSYVCSMVFDGLIKNDPAGNPVPSVAKEWKVSDDKLTYTFTLNDVKYHDGTKLTADDVKFTYELLVNKDYDGPYAYLASNFVGATEYTEGTATEVTGIKVIDPKTISFTITEPYAGQIYNFGTGILSKAYYGNYKSWDEFKALNQI